MQNTTNYNLNLPEGTDVVNPLVDYNPNFSTIDNVMKANANRTVGRATCIKSGTTHVVTRSNTDSPIINFTATGDWNEGDTMTIDSVIVSVFLPDGSAALDGAYIINSEVFGILNGTRFTLYSNIADVEASDVNYSNTASGLTASNVQDAIDEVLDIAEYSNKNNLVTPFIDLTGYTNSTPFTAPNDGYIHIIATSENSIATADLGGADGNTYISVQIKQKDSTALTDCVFVRKGMRLYGDLVGTGGVRYYELG